MSNVRYRNKEVRKVQREKNSLSVKGTGLKIISALLAISFLLSGPAAAETSSPIDIDTFVEQSLEKYNVPGAAIAVIDGDNTYIKGFGIRSVASKKPVDGDTVFMIASNSKSFTAALVGAMVDEGKLGFDDHVIDYLPDFVLYDSYATRNCTARDLLAHRSGLPALEGDALEALGFDRKEILRRIRFIEPKYSFRERDGYSNPGIFAAGMLAARLGGGTFEQMVETKLFEPLGMTRSGLSHEDHEKYENVADAHKPLPDGGSRVIEWDDADPLAPAGGITSTARDLSRFVRMLLQKGTIEDRRVLSESTVEEMWKPAMVAEPSFAEIAPIDESTGFAYSMGWGVYYYQGHKIIEKGGARAGVRSIITIAPEEKKAVIVLANQNLTVLPEAVRAYFLEKFIAHSNKDIQKEIEKASEKLTKAFSDQPKTDAKYAPMNMSLDKYAGRYENDLYGTLEIFEESGKLKWKAGPSGVSGRLEPTGYDTFLLYWPPNRITLPDDVNFIVDREGVATKVITDTFGELKRVKD